jgi:hypothetical protein
MKFHGIVLVIFRYFYPIEFLFIDTSAGMRLGKLTMKIGIALILWKFNLELSDKDMIDEELEFHPNQFVLAPLKLFDIKISSR